ncbi:MAG: RnfABCDGE type electron transport complex subunit D [Lachnospiraceae bacterium]|nr:RnfABCDGE type electron transport complex subunit D [Lachnospiraceae bacterium]
MNVNVPASPHIRSGASTTRIMLDMILALLPSLIAGILAFGLRALLVTLVSVGTAVAGETLYCLVTRKNVSVPDLSAVVTGLLFAMVLPASVPYYIVILGVLFAVVAVKGIAGGLGENTFNPALAGRAFLMLLFPVYLTRFAAAGAALPPGGFMNVDIAASATPLAALRAGQVPQTGLLQLFLWNPAGTIGGTSAAAILAGFVYLLARRVVRFRIPVAYLGTFAVLTFAFYRGENPLTWMLYSLLSGGVLFGAAFMASDYSSSPVHTRAQWLFGAGCGILTVLFRYSGLFPEGVTYAILLMNPLSWHLDRWFGRRTSAVRASRKDDFSDAWKPALAVALAGLVLFGAVTGLRGIRKDMEQAYYREVFGRMLPGSSTFTEIPVEEGETGIRKVVKGETGYVVEVAEPGYVDDIVLVVSVTNEGMVSGLAVKSSSETYGLGGEAASDVDFLGQFLGTYGDDTGKADALTGATETTEAVARAVRKAALYVQRLTAAGEGR